MKKHLFVLVFAVMALFQTAFSQDIKIKKDTAFVDGKALCIVKDRNLGSEYRILSLKGKELIFAKLETIGKTIYFTLSFLDNGAQCERQAEMGFGKKLVRELYERGALSLTEEGINADGLKKFLLTHTRKFSEEAKTNVGQEKDQNLNFSIKKDEKNQPNTTSDDDEPLVERNRSRSISTSFNKIEQDFKTIGTYKEESESVTGKRITILSPKGKPIAELVFKSMSDKEGKIFTFSDRRDYELPVTGSISSFTVIKDFAQFLIDKRYL
jgi:hypothetical protein